MRAVRTCLAALLLAALAATAPARARAEPFRLIVTDLAAPLAPNSVMELAGRLGYYAREGVEVELVRVQQTPSALAALNAGSGDMANVATEAALQLVAGGGMALKAVTSPNKALPFLIAARTGIGTPADLAGARFGIGRPGSLDHRLSAAVLRGAGLDPEALDLVALGQPETRARALASDRIDATTMSIGVWMALPDRTGLRVLIDPEAYHAAAPVVQKINVVTEATRAGRGDEIAAVIRALTRAARDFAADPALWVAAMTQARPDVDRADLETLAAAFAGAWSVNGGLNRDELALTADWLWQGPDFAGLAQPALEDWVDFSALDAALAEIGVAPGADRPVR